MDSPIEISSNEEIEVEVVQAVVQNSLHLIQGKVMFSHLSVILCAWQHCGLSDD